MSAAYYVCGSCGTQLSFGRQLREHDCDGWKARQARRSAAIREASEGPGGDPFAGFPATTAPPASGVCPPTAPEAGRGVVAGPLFALPPVPTEPPAATPTST